MIHKMDTKSIRICLLICLVLETTSANETEFTIVSTSQNPLNDKAVNDDLFPTCLEVRNNTQLLVDLKTQNDQIRKTLKEQINYQNEKVGVRIDELQKGQAQIIPEIKTIIEHRSVSRDDLGKTSNYIITSVKEITSNMTQNCAQVSQVQETTQKMYNLCDSEMKEMKNEIIKEIKLPKCDTNLAQILSQVQEIKDRQVQLEAKLSKIDKLEEEMSELHRSMGHLKSQPTDCKDIQDRGNTHSGIYQIRPELAPESFNVLCDMKVHGGGWAYLMTRFDGSEAFYRKWDEYKRGFGNLFGEFWLGLEHLYELTGYKNNELLIELVDWDDKKVYAHYKNFTVGRERENYQLKMLEGYSGDAKDSFSYHKNMNFSTFDNKASTGGYCASYFRGAWWYKACFTSHLTGSYIKGNSSMNAKQMGIHWNGFHKLDYSYSLKQARMMVRPSNGGEVLLPHEKLN